MFDNEVEMQAYPKHLEGKGGSFWNAAAREEKFRLCKGDCRAIPRTLYHHASIQQYLVKQLRI
eukprot:6055600-Amphidinium_carterae.1